MFKFIDLFAGIGGFRIGLERLGGKCVFSSEIDKHAVATYERNFGEKPAGDITKIAAEDVPDHDVLCGGFPCQPFSVSGKQLGFEDARGTLFFDVMRLVTAKGPRAVFLENVANFVRHRNGETLKRSISMLEDAGYQTKYAVLNASNYGIPQARKRVYIVGVRKDVMSGEFQFPVALDREVRLKDILLPKSKTKGMEIERDDIQIKVMDPKEIAKRRANKPIQIGIINKGGQGERIYSPEGHGITLSAHGGGAAAKTGAYLVDGIVRRLHPIECRRLMGFPDSFKMDPRKGQSYKQFGNAVIATMIEAIGKEMLNAAKLRWVQAEMDLRQDPGGCEKSHG